MCERKQYPNPRANPAVVRALPPPWQARKEDAGQVRCGRPSPSPHPGPAAEESPCFFHTTHPRSTPRSPSPSLNPSPSHASRGTAPRATRLAACGTGSTSGPRPRRAPRAPRDRPLVSFVRAGQGTQAVPLVGGVTTTRRAALGRPPARLWKLRRLCMARSLGLGRAGVVECGRKQPGRTVGGAAAGTPLGWLVHSLRCRSKTLMCCTQRPAPGCTCRYRSLHCFRRVDWEVIMPRRCAAG